MTPRLLPRLEGRFIPVLRVSDLDVSVVWYADAFGLSERSRHTPTPGRGQVVMTCPRTGLTLCLVSDGPAARGFDEHATGLDHLELPVADRAELSAWRAHLDSLGIPHSGIKEPAYSHSAMITLRDPDRIQVELFCVER